MIRKSWRSLCAPMLISLAACSTTPSGPSALALPGHQANETQFRTDEKNCRSFAHVELSGAPHQPKTLEEAQLYFDIHYLQCMYTKGHLIPISGEVLNDKTSGLKPDGSSKNPKSP